MRKELIFNNEHMSIALTSITFKKTKNQLILMR